MCVEPAGEFGVLELGELLWDELPPAKSQKKNQLNRLPAEEAKEKSRKPAPGRSRFCTLFHCFNFFGGGGDTRKALPTTRTEESKMAVAARQTAAVVSAPDDEPT